MNKSKEEQEAEKNPFAGFNLLGSQSTGTETQVEGDEEKPDMTGFEQALNAEKQVETPVAETSKEVESVETEETQQQIQQQTEEVDEDFSYKPIITHLTDKGILDYNEEDFKDEDFKDEEIFEKIQEQTLNKRFEKKLELYPEKLKKAIEWVENGGDIDQFVDYYYNNVRYSEIEMSSEDTELQKAILRDSLRAQGEEDEERIKNKIEKYELSGILEDEAADALDKLKRLEAKNEEERTKTQKATAEQNRLKQIEEWNTLKKAVLEAEDIAGFKVTPKIKEQLWEHMTKPVDKSGKTKLQLNNDTKGLKAKLLYAYLDMLDFDVTKLEKQVKTKVTSDLRKNLGKFTDTRNKIRGTGNTEVEADNPFAGFKRDF